jgi:hypothetical protein
VTRLRAYLNLIPSQLKNLHLSELMVNLIWDQELIWGLGYMSVVLETVNPLVKGQGEDIDIVLIFNIKT